MKEIFRRLRWLLDHRRFECELDEEILHHLAMKAAESGSAKAARRQFGNVVLIREESRAMWMGVFLEQLAQDIRYSLRMMACYSVARELHVKMALNIRNPEAEQLATELARRTGETKTEALIKSLRERLDRVRRDKSNRRLADELEEIAKHCAGLPMLDARSADEILGYDEHGLPR